MKNIRVVLIALLIFAFGTARGQDTLKAERTSIITLSLLTPTFSYAPRYNVGYMQKVAPRWWVGIEAGYGNRDITFGMAASGGTDYIDNDYRFFEVRPEVYYSLRNHGKVKHLVSAEFFYINHTDHFTNGKYYGKDSYPEYRYDEADYKRIKTGLNINYSLFFYFSPRVGLIWKTGFGVKYRDVTYSNVDNARLVDNSSDDEIFDIFNTEKHIEQSGSQFGGNFNMDLKLFYKF